MPLLAIDIGIVIVYLAGVLAFGVWIGRRENPDKAGFFLGGRNFTWPLIGTSLFATHISSIQFVGQSGLAYSIGMAAASPQLTGVICIAISAMFFIPVYLRTKIFTIPGFLEHRYNKTAKQIYAVIVICFGLCLTSIVLYSGSLVALTLFGLDNDKLFWCALILGLASGLYAITGGLSAVVHTDLIQSIVLLVGGICVLVLGLHAVGGVGELIDSVPDRHLDIILPADHPVMPYTAVFSGLLLMSLFWAASDQDLLQRTLGAKDLRNAQLGMLLGGFLKIVAVFVLVFPGILALDLVPGVNPDQAYPTLIQTVLPVGVSGIVLAGLLAAIMSTLDSSIMSLSSIFTIDIYPRFAREPNETQALKVGRIVAVTILLWAIVTAPLLQHLGLIYLLLQKVINYLLPAVGVCYVIGRFNKRVNSFGAVVTMSLGFVIGISFLLMTTVPAVKAISPDIIVNANFFHVSFFLILAYAAILLISSRFRPAPAAEDLAFMEPTEQERIEQSSQAGGLFGSFRFWVALYVIAFVAVFVIF